MLLAGCATSRDLRVAKYGLDSKILSLEKELSLLKKESSRLKKNSVGVEEITQTLRKSQADTGADFINLRADLQKLRGNIEKVEKELKTFRTGLKNEDLVNIRQKFDDLSFRVKYMESFLGIEKKKEAGQVLEKTEKKTITALKEKIDKEKSNSEAYKTFRQGKYDEARRKFREFIKVFPDTEYSDNAQFWIGECYYFEKNYEKAILEYESVIKNYPKGNKVPNALLKQALSFIKLGDKSSAKLLLQRVIKDYPNTSPAKTARVRLLSVR
jgi:tol-pal system protein YbgF